MPAWVEESGSAILMPLDVPLARVFASAGILGVAL
jgi:hypothetical protein